MEKYNVGIVGYGWGATAHIPAINATSLAQVTAIYSSRKLDSVELSSKYGGNVTPYDDLDARLANPDNGVVSIWSYRYQHAEQGIKAPRAGNHLIIEKPLCLSLKDLQAMDAS